MMNTGKLAGLTVFITGGSRGIGKTIALKVAKDGANVVIAAKTAEPHPKLPGTIYTTCEEVEKAGGKGLPCIVDVRNEQQVQKAVEETVKKFGGIDILINNASAISLTPTEQINMKMYDLMHNVNTRGTFLVSKECAPYLKKSSHAHILNLSPPLLMSPVWFKNNLAYTMAKYGMSMCVLGMHEEFRPYNIGVNALWPRTAIHTAAIEMVIGGKEGVQYTRKPEIMADAAYAVLTSDPKTTTGNFFIDDEVLKKHGVTDFDQYCVDPTYKNQLMPDLFVDIPPESSSESSTAEKAQDAGKVGAIFSTIEKTLTPEIVQKTQAVYQFEVTGSEAGNWYIDLKSGSGSCGKGEAPSAADATFTMDTKHFFDMFAGKLKPANAFMMGKLKISGNMQKALQLDKLMSILKSKL